MEMPKLEVHRVVTSPARVFRRLAANAIAHELERRVSATISFAAVPESLVVYRMKAILDHIDGAPTTEPIVRAEVLVDTGTEDVTVPFFDIRLRDWLCLDDPELAPGEVETVSFTKSVMSNVLVPDEHSPVY